MALRKPSDLFKEELEEFNLPVVEQDNFLRGELKKVENLSNQVLELQQELAQKVVKNDLETLVLSQINEMREKFNHLQNDIKKSNSNDIKIFNEQLAEIAEVVNDLIHNEISKYKKQITKNELVVGEKVSQLKNVIEENIVSIREEIDDKFENIAEVVDHNINYFNEQLQETSSQVKETKKIYSSISKILENKVSQENARLVEYSQTIESIQEAFNQLRDFIDEENSISKQSIENLIEEEIDSIKIDVNEKINSFTSSVKDKVQKVSEQVGDIQSKVSSEISNLKADIVIFEKHNKDTEKTIREFSEELVSISELSDSISDINENIEELKTHYNDINNETLETKKDLEIIEKYIQNHHNDIQVLKEEVFSEIENLPVGNLQENIERLERKIDYIKETYSKIEPEVIVKEVIKEGLLNEPPETKNSDPLTPLNQNFVTLDQLQQHYRLFINRIQQQLSTLGGGGETQLRYLDDIVGIATDVGSYDGKFLKYDHTLGKFIFETISSSGIDIGLIDLNDIDVPTIADNKYLKYNETTGKFDFKYLDISDFSIDIDGGASSTIHEPLEFIVADGGNAPTNFYLTDLTIGGGGA